MRYLQQTATAYFEPLCSPILSLTIEMKLTPSSKSSENLLLKYDQTNHTLKSKLWLDEFNLDDSRFIIVLT